MSEPIKYDKLVRNKIPDLTYDRGDEAYYRKIKDEQMFPYISKKINESTEKYMDASSHGDKEDIKECLADMLELVYRAIETSGFTTKEINELRSQKNLGMGSFSENVIIDMMVIKGD